MACRAPSERAAFVDALDDVHAVEHRPGSAVPFGHDQDVPGAELVDRLLELRAVFDVLAGGLLAEDLVAARRC